MDVGSVNASFTSYGSHASGNSAGELESDIGREALREICCSTLSRLLDFSDNKLEILLGEDGGDNTASCTKNVDSGGNVARNIANKFRSISHKLKFDEGLAATSDDTEFPVLSFGIPINEDSEIVILQLISHMEKFILEEGLFRKSGSRTRVNQLAHSLETTPLHLILSDESYTPHDYASVFKQYFSSLPEPLMTNRHSEAYKQAAELSNDASRTLCIQLLVLLLPPSHHSVLCQLLNFLSTVAMHSNENKMDAHNLSVVFAPTLFFDTKSPDNVVPELIPKMMSLLQHMIKTSTDIFEVPTEVRVVAERYMRRRGTKQTEDVNIPLDMYVSTCQQTSTSDQFHQNGKDTATAELASLYEFVCKMPDGPQKQNFLKKFSSSSKMAKMAGSPAPYTKCKKSTKENLATPKIKLQKGVGSHQITTPMRPSFMNKGKMKLDQKTVQLYATPLKPPKANLTQYERLETDV